MKREIYSKYERYYYRPNVVKNLIGFKIYIPLFCSIVCLVIYLFHQSIFTKIIAYASVALGFWYLTSTVKRAIKNNFGVVSNGIVANFEEFDSVLLANFRVFLKGLNLNSYKINQYSILFGKDAEIEKKSILFPVVYTVYFGMILSNVFTGIFFGAKTLEQIFKASLIALYIFMIIVFLMSLGELFFFHVYGRKYDILVRLSNQLNEISLLDF
ncbi:MAG: hypothetical protein HQL26_06940 [Candidatus Omnitrophica bacterium]|nr:hypothetical protein [Candidatus Omnitrophota bacterium]